MGGRYRQGMLRPLCFLPLVVALSGCTGLGSAKVYSPKSAPEFRTAAASLTGRDVNNSVPENPENPNPRILLKPSPGRAPLIGENGTEVLQSSNRSGAYMAFTGQVPVTQFFRVVGRADCDDWVYLQLMTPSMIRGNPNYYISGTYTGDKATLKCVGKFHEAYRDKTDPRLANSDGVVFYAESAFFTEVDGFSIAHKKLHMDGWAIKFADPTPEDIKARLSTVPIEPIDFVQMKTVAYWIEKNLLREYAADLKKLLPHGDRTSWRDVDHAVLKALAVIDPENAPDDIYKEIMMDGLVAMVHANPRVTIASTTAADAPFVAANVLACRNNPGTKELMERVLLQATIRQHKLAAAHALIAMGYRELVQLRLRDGSLGDVSTTVATYLDGRDPYMFTCPGRSTNIDKV